LHGGFLKWIVLRELEKGKGKRDKGKGKRMKRDFLMEMI
jgi:hypothetical protein